NQNASSPHPRRRQGEGGTVELLPPPAAPRAISKPSPPPPPSIPRHRLRLRLRAAPPQTSPDGTRAPATGAALRLHPAPLYIAAEAPREILEGSATTAASRAVFASSSPPPLMCEA
ncbi:unnamed protein product, partial [Urochloa humidicola]